ncbi:aminotransferase [Methylophaga sp. 42_25_T18]|nr:aminotransferase [Methylophaga sp. 42_25_T18]
MGIRTEPMSSWPEFDDEQVEAVGNALRSGKVNYWTGEHGRLFEGEYADYVGCKYGIAVANGTVALELALYALGVGTGDEVITTCRTFIATASGIIVRGAIPVFADVDKDSQNITLDSIKKVVTPKTKVIIAVHLAGWPCDMDEIMAFAAQRGIKVIEDCAQAHGATYDGQQVGSLGDIAAFSFCQDKIMTTGGEGGMVTTSDKELWSKMWAYKDHGKSWQLVHEQKHPPGFRWLHDSIGTNWRMTEMQAVLGRIQLKRLASWTGKRLSNANRIWDTARQCIALRVPEVPDKVRHAAYKCYVFVNAEMLKPEWNRARIMDEINALGIPCFSGSCSEVYLEKAFDSTDFQPKESLPIAKELGETALMFLVHPTLTDDEINQTCTAITHVMTQATESTF